jgi:hypothetical protein
MPIFDAARGEHGERPAELDGKGWANRHVPIPRPDHPPMDGYRYTWEDDALNIRMREEEAKRPYGVLPTLAGKAQPKWDDPGRCRGFSKENVRPCRAWAQRNVEGNYTRFCLKHSETSKKRMGKEAAHLTTPAMVVSGATGQRLPAKTDRDETRRTRDRRRRNGTRRERGARTFRIGSGPGSHIHLPRWNRGPG